MNDSSPPFTVGGYKVEPRLAKDEKGQSCFAFFLSPSLMCTPDEAEANARLFENSPGMFKLLQKAHAFIYSMKCVKEGNADKNMQVYDIKDVAGLEKEIIDELKRIMKDKI